ncbi:MAG: DNA translocase FtsK 4TM domain-containing protein, partial [Limisphaerales bacterium]
MSRKTADSNNGFGDVIGIALLAAALLLLVAQFSFDRYDLAFFKDPHNQPIHNWIGTIGAYLAWGAFLPLGFTAYLLPLLLAAFGAAYLLNFPGYLRERLRWSLLWSAVLLISLTGLLYIMDNAGWLGKIHESIGSQSAGGWLGYMTYGQTQNYNFGFSLLGPIGATIIYAALGLISLLFLTNFRLGVWIRALLQREKLEKSESNSGSEGALERRARDLEMQAKQLQEQVARSGLGADGLPVPEPTVRDLSVPQAKPNSARIRKTTLPESRQDAPDDESEVIPAREISAATTEEILGKKSEETKSEIASSEKTDSEKSAEEKVEPEIKITGIAPAKSKAKRPKPITVAQTPMIGNYQLPSLDFLQHPDMTAKPTESKEELMANARLMQQTLAQFDIEVSLGDITKGPTITRYELHPAPGVKLEKISALSNNIAAALKAERIHILAPVPGKSSVGIEVPNLVKTKVIMRDLLESDEWRNSKARIPLALGKDVYGHPIVADLSEMPHLLIAGSTGSGKSVCINAIIASLLYRFSPDQLRFVMIDPKVVELQQYNTLPHLVVPVVTDPKKVLLALRWVVSEMEKRYQIFARCGCRNIGTFNSRPNKKLVPQEPDLPLT